MKKTLLILMLLACVVGTASAAITYDADFYKQNRMNITSASRHNDPVFKHIEEFGGMLGGTSSSTITNLLFSQETSDPCADEGRLYYNATSQVFRYRKDGSWANLAAESGTVSLDVAYGNGNTIDVDGSAVTLDNDTTDENVLLILTQDDTTSNNDAMTIVVTGTGDALQITGGATTGGGLNVVSFASGLAPLITVDGSTNNWDGANDKGQVLIQADDPYINAGATGLMILDSSTPIAAAEGFLARFVHSGSARASTSAVEIQVDDATQTALTVNSQVIFTGQDNSSKTTLNIVGNDSSNNTHALDVHNEGTAAAVLITPDDTTTPALLVTGKANSSVTVVTIDGASGAWIGGADDVAMVEITGGATANADAGGGLFAVISATTPAVASEGFLARFIHTGSARASSWAVEIETANTQGALNLNNNLTLSGASGSGTLLNIVHIGASGDADGIVMTHNGTGDAFQITLGETDSMGIHMIAAANQTTSTVFLDGTGGNWIGADDVGMLQITADTQNANVGTPLVFIQATYSPKASSEGFLMRLEQKTGAAVTTAYAMEIETTATTPCLKLNGQMSIAGQGTTDGVLLDIVSADTTADTVQLTGVGTADVLQITSNATTSVGLNIVAKASGTTADVYIDATAGWIGASDVGLVTIVSDSALTDAAATLLLVKNATGQIKADAQGHLARFVDAAAARTGAHAVEIKTTNTTPCLLLNNRLTITGADSATTLVAITGNDTTGNSDTMTINHDGTDDGLQITCDGTTSVALHLIGATAQTTALAEFDGATGTWLGAAGVGMVELSNDGTPASATASLMSIAQSGTGASSQLGVCLRLEDTSTSGGGTPYTMYIASTNSEALFIDSGTVLIDESLTATLGVQFGLGQTITADDSEGIGQVDDGVSYVTVTAITVNADDFITLPDNPPVGTVLIVSANGVAFEIRTLQSGNDTINTVDTSDGGTEYIMNNLDIATFIYFAANSWTGTTITTAGVRSGTVIPN